MEKFIKRFFLFLAMVVVLNLLYLLVLMVFSPGLKKIYDISRFENQKFETIILGNSMALDALDAEYLTKNGMSTYNLSVAGDHVSTSLLLLEEYLKKNQKPKMVVVGLSSAIGKSYLNPVAFTNPEVEFFYHPNLWHNITNPPLLNFQWLAVDLLKIVLSKDHRNATMVLGQWKTKKVIPDQARLNYSNNTLVNYDDPYLARIIALCEEQNIKVVLVELPGSKDKRNALPFEKQYKINTKKLVTIYNLNNYHVSESIIDPSKDWLAADHLNQFGGEKITAFLFKEVFQKQK